MTTSPSSSNPTEPDATDPLDNPTRSDITAASTSPTAIRSEEGPGVSDTDDPAKRAQAGSAGKSAFEQVANPDA